MEKTQSGLPNLQTLVIPQNRQRNLWKGLEKKGADLERLGKKLEGLPLPRSRRDWPLAPTSGVSKAISISDHQLTFKATKIHSLQALCENGLLVEKRPLRPRAPNPLARTLLVTPCIDDLLSGRKPFGVFPDASAEKWVGIFCAG